MSVESTTSVQLAGKYLTFALDAEHYGIEILKVREIIEHLAATRVPGTPNHVRGVINLRGQVIPVMDLRTQLGMNAVEPTKHTCIIVVETKRAGRRVSRGLIVDRVIEVMDISENSITDSPEFGPGVDVRLILGMAKVGDGVTILLNIDLVAEWQE